LTFVTEPIRNDGMDIDKVLTEKIKYDILKLEEIKDEYEKVLV
jgi:hypothetical protein